MSPVPATISNEIGAQLNEVLRKCRVVGAADFTLRRLEREVEKLKSVDVFDFWRLSAVVSYLRGDREGLLKAVRITDSMAADPEAALRFFPLLVSMGEVEVAYGYVSDRLVREPVSDYSALAGYLYFMLDVRRLTMLQAFMLKIGHVDDLPNVNSFRNEAMDVIDKMPDAPRYVELVAKHAAAAAEARGILLAVRPSFRFDLEEDCLYCTYPVRVSPEDAVKLEDSFWMAADAAHELQDGNVHVVFRSSQFEG